MDAIAVSCGHVGQTARSGDGILGHLADTFQKELNPRFPFPLGPYCIEKVIVLSPMGFEIEAEVEEGFVQHPFKTKEKGDEESPDPSVSVEKRVNRLELSMGKSRLDEKRESFGLVMEE